jgi:hypothetical protein
VPWYNLHKVYAGLRDAYHIGKNEQAKAVLIGMADWCDALFATLSDDQVQQMLRAEHGGMNEVLADVHEITGNDGFLDLAQRFSHRALLDPLAAGRDTLDGLHANTQIPKVIGFARLAALGAGGGYGDSARFFWQTVTGTRSFATGGHGDNEHFFPRHEFAKRLGIEHDDGAVFEAQPVAHRPRPQLLVDALARHADHLADLLLGDRDRSTGAFEFAFFGQAEQRAGKPPRKILKDDLFDLIAGPAQPPAEQFDEFHRERRLAVHEG